MNYQIATMLSIGMILSALAIYLNINRFIQPIIISFLSLMIYNIFILFNDGNWILYKDPLWVLFIVLYIFYTILENIAIQVIYLIVKKINLF